MDALDVRPRWRGVIHRAAVPGFAVAFTTLIVETPSRDGNRLAVIVYALGVLAMFGVSAVYHATAARPSTLSRVLQRVDHGTILLAIAGSYTAVTALGVTGHRRGQLLVGMWVVATIGIAVQMLWLHAPRAISATIYVLVGWFVLVDMPAYLKGTTSTQLAWIAIGGLLYTVGGAIYAAKKPNPRPDVFGYHEVFHALTVAGAACHFVAVALLARSL